jgi:ABC-type multidrug transport system fused ATPase/permease subunit
MGTLILLDIIINVADIAFLALLLFLARLFTEPAAHKMGPFSVPAWLIGANPVLPIVVFFLLYGVKNFAGFLVYRAQCRFLSRIATRISEKKLSGYLNGSYGGYVNVDSSVNVREISYDPTEFAQHILGGMQQIITQATLILFTVVAIVFFNAKLFLLLFLILLPPVYAIIYFIKVRRRSARDQVRNTGERSLQHLQEALTGYVESNIYHKNGVFLDRYIAYQKKFNQYISDQLIIQGIPNRVIETFALLGVMVLILVNRWSGNAAGTSFISIGVFMAAAYKIIPGIVRILSIGGQINTYAFTINSLAQADAPGLRKELAGTMGKPVAAMGKLTGAVKELTGAMVEPTGTVEVEAIRCVAFRHVCFHYAGMSILDDLNFQVRPGDFLGISGLSGKGKTTILNLLLGFLAPASGEISINGAMADASMRQQYWKKISYVKQQAFLVHDTLLRNIILDEKTHDARRLEWAIRSAGLGGLIDSFPEGLDKVINENGKNISGGQRQRIAIARALYKDADLILLDEPFNELDEGSEDDLLHCLRDLTRRGKSVMLITHNKKSLSFCNKTISLDA